MALILSLQCFLANLRYQSLFSVHYLEATILLFELLHSFHERGIHANKFKPLQAFLLKYFFCAVDEMLSEDPTFQLFTCSASQKVIDGFRDRYGDALVLYPSIRSEFGEMHANHSENKGIQFPGKNWG